jgi:predicted Zn-dependent peptidase
VFSITADTIKAYHDQHYVGNNIVVSGAGDINATQFRDIAAKKFGEIKADVIGVVPNTEHPFFTPSLMFQRDD